MQIFFGHFVPDSNKSLKSGAGADYQCQGLAEIAGGGQGGEGQPPSPSPLWSHYKSIPEELAQA